MTDPKAALTTPTWFRALAERHGDAEAMVDSRHRLTYRQLDEQSAVWARGLLARGVGKRSRIGLWMGNGVEWLVSFAAVTRIGAVAVPLSTFFKGAELARVVRHADLQGLVVQQPFLGEDMLARLESALPELAGREGPTFAVASAPSLRWVVAVGPGDPRHPWAAPLGWLRSGAGDPRFDARLLAGAEAEVDPDDEAIMIYTSGSTADPKGVPHPHRTVLTKTHYLREWLPLADGTRSFGASPFFWVGGLTMSLFPVLDGGGTQYCTDRFDAGEFLAMLGREHFERAYLYPHHVNALLEHPEFATTDRTSLREADPRLLSRPPADRPPDQLLIGLGMTETFGGYWWGRPGSQADTTPLRPGERRPPPLDVVQPGVELKVARPDGTPVEDGEIGEIRLRGSCITPGLHKLAHEQTFDAEGYFCTGDRGQVAGDQVYFRGRLSDMIKTAGANVSPAEVAAALRAIEGVEEAYVFGRPDALKGEVVVAAVVPEAGHELDVEAVRSALRGQISAFKVPVRIGVFSVDEIPWTPSHKVRGALLAELVDERTLAAPVGTPVGAGSS